MPINPEYIALPKSKEMFAIASWRDSPAPSAATHLVISPSPHLNSLDALRGSKNGTSTMPGVFTTTNTAAGALSPAPVLPAAEDAAKAKADVPSPFPSPATGGKKKKRKSAAVAGGATGTHPDDVDDFFVHILLPAGVAVQTLEFELQAQATPLKMIEVGLPKVVFPRKAGANASSGAEGSASNVSAGAPPPSGAATAKPGMVLSPFCTPAVVPIGSENGLPPMSLPPADLLPEPALARISSGAAHGAAGATTDRAPSPTSPPPAVTSAGGTHHGGDFQVSLLFAEKAEAEKTMAFVQRRWPTAAVSTASRSRSVLNATLVLKGLPNQAKTETVLAEIQKLPHPPSYVRLLRSERGVFKGVVFVKYANCEVSEECKLRLEQFVLGSRPLKVEFKKKSSAASAASEAASENKRSLQELVRDLRVSTEYEGFHLDRTEVSKEELKVLKQLCQSYGLHFDINDQRATVRRVLGANGTLSEKPSPALRPQSATPVWVPATPAPLRPMDFKGISHWKDIRNQANTLGIVRPLGPEDGKPAFSAGRGRPL
ncbi:hypothetical protein ABB37_05672 [Leptomonas pyrrhocoris]|uniref:RRM domain-containing protein n=1 Tax=Leptomonas pyrrhocoris TaxID=157538 RepID=A0A0M9FZP2_LEPPY|nr:hypothetical protein ABB37_05672 [Leptomonas pyrrhocoris]KPA79176.1 hypothetical protein ABB37_05672 [Leptomonas pyrrhocoris]|eukprot:XP_015657615.1 hypothetical protein ABB37_05672 [Leptomonas pyrrhocoris]